MAYANNHQLPEAQQQGAPAVNDDAPTVAEASRVIDALNTDAAERNTEGPSA